MFKLRLYAIFLVLLQGVSIVKVNGMLPEDVSDPVNTMPGESQGIHIISQEFPGLEALGFSSGARGYMFDLTDPLASIFKIPPHDEQVEQLIATKLATWKQNLNQADDLQQMQVASRVLGILEKMQEYLKVDTMTDRDLGYLYLSYYPMDISAGFYMDRSVTHDMRAFIKNLLKHQLLLAMKKDASRAILDK
jgi:hypothetical protein